MDNGAEGKNLASFRDLRRLWTQAGLVLALLLSFASHASAQGDDRSAVAKIGEVTPLEAGRAREFYGRVVAFETVDLAFQVGGQVIAFPVVEGPPSPRGP